MTTITSYIHSTRRALSGRSLSVIALAILTIALLVTGVPFAGAASPRNDAHSSLPPIKHVWFIILENKSYDASFTGLNNNTYLWKTLPTQGMLLTHYYGTGHYSLDNYIALASGQAPQADTQADCPTYKDMAGHLDVTPGDPNYGQYVANTGTSSSYSLGAGCVYPSNVPTLFNQLSAAHVTWKAYAQDLGNPDSSGATHAVSACGAPSSNPTTTPVPNPGAANLTDQYVPKHFPLPWFHSIIDNPSTNCSSAHVANLFDPTNGLYADLQNESTTPEFNWITPNNCSDAHDAVCHGNNLSGGFSGPNTINPPLNYTGGLYAADLFLQHVIPEIEASPAFKDNGLIDVSFDEGFPAFTFTGNSFANSSSDPATAASSLASDTAGENINGQNVNTEPTGPNTPLATDASGNQLLPGPGNNAFIDRNPAITGLVMGGAGTVPGARTDAVIGSASSAYINDPSISVLDQGRAISGTNIPANATVGTVYNDPATAPLPAGGGCSNSCVVSGTFELLVNGVATAPSGPVSSVTLAPETMATDPLYNATSATNGGGDVGAVLISKFIKPGSTDATFYNHYSWLRSMEDIFQVASASPGLDGEGHIGFAAQPGLAAFGPDVFNNYRPHAQH